MRIIIFTKSRAAQVELLLRSIKEQVCGWKDSLITVFHDFDDREYGRGYSLLKEIHPEFHYYERDHKKSLKEQLRELISMEKKDFFSFFVDDLVVIRPFSKEDKQFKILKERKDIMFLSSRLNPNINYSQPLSMKVYAPNLDSDMVFCVKKTNFGYFLERNIISRLLRKNGFRIFMPLRGDWGCQMSIDGNIYRYEEFREYFNSLPEFSYVPDLEEIMMKHPLSGSKVIIYPESRIVNIASNKVDKIFLYYPSAGEDPLAINERFLNNGRLSYDHLKSLNNTSCHIETKLTWQ